MEKMVEDWPELTELVEQIRTQNGEGWQRIERLRQELGSLQAHLELVSRQAAELDIEGHLRLLNERLLAGLGNLESIHSGMGIERIVALAWPADLHPQPGDDQAVEGGIYRIEVWLGPGLQDGRTRIRIAGSKRLEAVLPTTPERFRSALLTVFRSPLYVASPAAQAEEPKPEGAENAPPGAQAEPAAEQAPPEDEPPPEAGQPDLTNS